DRAPGAVLVDLADAEVLVVAAEGFAGAVLADTLGGLDHGCLLVGMKEGTGNQDAARASSAMRRAFLSSGASTIFPWNRKAPLPWPSGTACSSTVAHSTSAGVGVKAACMVLICCG